MVAVKGYAIKSSKEKLKLFQFERREPTDYDVAIDILFCGVCHSDIHQARNEWGNSIYPMVPGHEIVGRVTHVGSQVKKFKKNDIVGVGCFVDSCRNCDSCQDGEEQFCKTHLALTYNGTEMDTVTPTFGGYSSHIVVDEKYVLAISSKLTLASIAPLLCAGITTYSPLRRFKVGPNQQVAVIGLGGLGHMGVKFAAAMGAEVTVLSTSLNKKEDAFRLGAKHFVITKDPNNLQSLTNHFDFILDTVAAKHDLTLYLNLLKRGGAMVLVGVPDQALSVYPFSLITNRRILAGSLIGGIKETQEMLDFCAEKNIVSDVEVIPMQKIEEAYQRTITGDVKFRFVIDMSKLSQG